MKKICLFFLFVSFSTICFSQTKVGKDSLAVKVYTSFVVNKEGVVETVQLLRIGCSDCNESQKYYLKTMSNDVIGVLKNKKIDTIKNGPKKFMLPIRMIVSKKEFDRLKN